MKNKSITISFGPLIVAALYFLFDWTWHIWIFAVLSWLAMGFIGLALWIFYKLGEQPGSLATAIAGGYSKNITFNRFMISTIMTVISLITFWHAGFVITFFTYLVFMLVMNATRVYYMLENA